MDPASILKIMTNSTWMVTQLLGESRLQFEKKSYNLSVSESTKPGPLLQLTVKVRTKEVKVVFDLVSGNDGGHFHVDSSTGLLSLTSPLDYETAKKHEFLVRAFVGENSSETQISVRVLDANDHIPKFERDHYETQITEEDERHLPKPILRVVAIDEDDGEFGRMHYSLVTSSIRGTEDTKEDTTMADATNQRFRVDPNTGDILLLQSLDRDSPTGRSRWSFAVLVSDGGFEASCTVVVNVKDVNDNAPFFPRDILHATVSENRPEGTTVGRVVAVDRDDASEGTNARLRYSLQKNVVDEATAKSIFVVDPLTGRISTALCCLDRETTPSYTLQVVATDGGGLKGTGTVLVSIMDENDVAPKFTRPEWYLDVEEELPPSDILASLSVVDPDITNAFRYRIVTGSGKGWDQFFLSAGNKTGSHLRSKMKLDYENPDHRRGFRFQVQVNDMARAEWDDKYHVGSAWVNIRLRDCNDNGPHFVKISHYRRVGEDLPLGAPIGTVTALDADGRGKAPLDYVIDPRSDPHGQFRVEIQTGLIRLEKPLDHENLTQHHLQILAFDQGEPVRNATATFVIDVLDVNDNPPFFSCPTFVTIKEDSTPQVVTNLTLDDPDDWTKGHGPPFTLYLDPKAPTYIKQAISVEFDPEANNGVGVGVIRTKMSLDREERRRLTLPIVVLDAGDAGMNGVGSGPRQSATLTFTLALTDVNDNRMTPASKHVLAHLLQVSAPSSSNPVSSSTRNSATQRVPLGRIFVLDPDDSDFRDKKFRWGRPPEQYFHLESLDGGIFMDPWTPPGMYTLQFLVSDTKQGQLNVPANVTVEVKNVQASELRSAVPIDLVKSVWLLLRPTKPASDTPFEAFRRAIASWGGTQGENYPEDGIAIVGLQSLGPDESREQDGESTAADERDISVGSRLWINGRSTINLHHILLHRREEIKRLLGEAPTRIGAGDCPESKQCPSGCWVMPQVEEGFVLVDENSLAFVGPQLSLVSGCGCHPPDVRSVLHPNSELMEGPFLPRPVVKETSEGECGQEGCLNGGRCAPRAGGALRCICPHGTEEPHCKIGQRFFHGDLEADWDSAELVAKEDYFRTNKVDGRTLPTPTVPPKKRERSWAWLLPLPSCAEVHISLEFMTSIPRGVLLFSGESVPPINTSPEESTIAGRHQRERFLRRRRRDVFRVFRSMNTKFASTTQGTSTEASIMPDGMNLEGRFGGSTYSPIFLSQNPEHESYGYSARRGSVNLSPKVVKSSIYQPQISKKKSGSYSTKAKGFPKQPESPFNDFGLSPSWTEPPIDFQSHIKETKRTIDDLETSIFNSFSTSGGNETLPLRRIRHSHTQSSKISKTLLRNSNINQKVPLIHTPHHFPGLRHPSMEMEVGGLSSRLNEGTNVPYLPISPNENSKSEIQRISRRIFRATKEARRRNPSLKTESNISEKDEFFLLRLVGGKPHLALNFGGGDISLALSSSSAPLADLKWHRIDIIWRDQLVEMIVDLCSGASFDAISHPPPPSPNFVPSPNPPDALHCRVAAPLPEIGRAFNFRGPLQVGGVSPDTLKSVNNPLPSFHGCVRDIRVNGQLQDLGSSIISSRSVSGCPAMDCSEAYQLCSDRGRCVGSPGKERCECLPGWTGTECQHKTEPVRFGDQSFAKVALSFAPLSLATTLQLRLRTRRENGELISLSSAHEKDQLALFLRGGHVCLSVRLHPQLPSLLCLTRIHLHDGEWHSVKAMRVGSALLLTVDSGDGHGHYNASLLLDGRPLLSVDREDGISLGGRGEFLERKLIVIRSDFARGCIDDLRLQGRSLPLSPGSNRSQWAQVTSSRHVTEGCQPTSPCLNVSCPFPLSCIDTWELYHCGCQDGFSLSLDGQMCADVNECTWSPCLYGGICRNSISGYSCSCALGYTGFHCHMQEEGPPGTAPSLVIVLGGAALSCFLLLLVVILWVAYCRRRTRRKRNTPQETKTSVQGFARTDESGQLYHGDRVRGAEGSITELSMLRHDGCSFRTLPLSISDLNLSLGGAENQNIAELDVLKIENRTKKNLETFQSRCKSSSKGSTITSPVSPENCPRNRDGIPGDLDVVIT